MVCFHVCLVSKQQLGELKAELEKKNTQIEQLQKLLDEKDKEIESLKNKTTIPTCVSE